MMDCVEHSNNHAEQEQCSSRHASESEEHFCWICLDGPKLDEPLLRPCACPKLVHHRCLARWQLFSAGKNEESLCRFCNKVLPDWRPALTPLTLKPASSVMSVRYRGVTHRITYTPGDDGLDQFLKTLESIGIRVASASQVTFLCRSPDTGEEVALKGLKAFDAAAYCASITAAKRMQKDQKRRNSDCSCKTDIPGTPTHTEQACDTALVGDAVPQTALAGNECDDRTVRLTSPAAVATSVGSASPSLVASAAIHLPSIRAASRWKKVLSCIRLLPFGQSS